MNSRTRLALTVGLCGLLAGAAALAGPLDPPAGPVAPTMKPLDQIEPRTAINAVNTPGDADSVFRITQPGSYYLTGTLIGQAGKSGIEIAASGVTLDLNGFDLLGEIGTLDGIRTVNPLVLITITNGEVVFWGGDGINLASASSCRITGVTGTQNVGAAIRVGDGAVLTQCLAQNNVTGGAFNGAGVIAGGGASISNCTARLNTGHGIVAAAAATVTDCSVQSNTGDGIKVAAGSTVTACSAHSNGSRGIAAPSGSTATDGQGSTISGCTAFGNALAGVAINAGSMVLNCTLRNNPVGVQGSSRNVIRGNICTGSTTAGISVGDTLNIIEGNTCNSGNVGVQVTFAGSLIVGNTCANNTLNWSIAANNRVGPIVLCNVNPVAISTNGSAAGSLTSSDPFTNFSY